MRYLIYDLDPQGARSLVFAAEDVGVPVTIALNTTLLGTLDTPEELAVGRAFRLSDGSTLQIRAPGELVQVLFNGLPLAPRSAAPWPPAPTPVASNREPIARKRTQTLGPKLALGGGIVGFILAVGALSTPFTLSALPWILLQLTLVVFLPLMGVIYALPTWKQVTWKRVLILCSSIALGVGLLPFLLIVSAVLLPFFAYLGVMILVPAMVLPVPTWLISLIHAAATRRWMWVVFGVPMTVLEVTCLLVFLQSFFQQNTRPDPIFLVLAVVAPWLVPGLCLLYAYSLDS